MSILSLPTFIFVYYGSNIQQNDRDIFGLYKYTYGNLGYDSLSPTYTKDSTCTSSTYKNHHNTTCIHYLSSSEISVADASVLIMYSELLQVLVFLLGTLYITRKVHTSQMNKSSLNLSASDYTIFVKNIPPDTTEVELIEHFSLLYQLSRPDWLGRPALQNAIPVINCDNTGNSIYIGSWCAEVVVHKAIGSLISSFKGKQHLMQNLYKYRAQMKMFAENTPHSHGHNLKLFLQAEQNMLATASRIDKLAEEVHKSRNVEILPSSLVTNGSSAEFKTIYSDIDAKSVGAFVVFNYVESMARCIEDYKKYSTFPYNLVYPHDLKFKGHKLKIYRASEPDQIIWENLEATSRTKFLLRFRTILISFLLVVICFMVILQSSIYRTLFSANIPKASFCKSLPRLYSNKTIPYNSLSNINFIRPTAFESYDSTCSTIQDKSFYAVYSYSTSNFSNTLSKYSYDACHPSLCPIYGSGKFCPCVSTLSSDSCDTLDCYTHSGTDDCVSFSASLIGSCYCYVKLQSLLSTFSILQVFSLLNSPQSKAFCGTFFTQYSLSTGLTYLSIGFTVILNFINRFFLKILTSHECHTSLDREEGSLMLKVFISNYITLAIIVLVAYGKVSNKPDILSTIHIFDGPYNDFTPAWYGNVGFILMTTFIVATFAPLLLSLLKYYIIWPCLRLYHYSRVRKMTSKSMVMQQELNKLEIGPEVKITLHTAQLLSYIFFAMTFASGLPLMLPLITLSFIMYFNVDKLLLLRFNVKPPYMGDGSIRTVIALLPYAAVVRMAVACWIFGNSVIIPLNEYTNDNYSGMRSAVSSPIGDRLYRPNVYPLFIGLIIVASLSLLPVIYPYLPIYWIYKTIKIINVYFYGEKDLYQKNKEKFKSDTDNEINDSHGKNHNTSAVDKQEMENSIHPWELMKTGDPKRQG